MEVAIKRLFIQGPSLTARVVLLSLLSVVLMTLDHREGHLDAVRGTLALALAPLQYAVDLPASAGDWAVEAFSTQRHLRDDNDRLRTQNLLLKAQMQKMASLESENQRLRALLHSSERVAERTLIAELLAVDLDPYRRKVVLNRGGRHGVFAGQPLLDAYGVMGQITHTSALTSTALLITDPAHAVPVQVNRNGLRALAVGTGADNQLELPHLPNNADIVPGDLLVTSGLGGRFPAGYPVGTVVRVDSQPGLPFARVVAEPTAQLDRSRQVLLVWLEERATQAVADAAPEPAGTLQDAPLAAERLDADAP
ncbi:rod shape-determining protein MreC [Ectothiorhodospiraceae bacterium 2226]|nr:rod shape-determining protein MreC [Ectothiorhodospiraceae bacterium 2226]